MNSEEAILIKDYHQWHCSNCGGIFKQDREPEISYCLWCGRKFMRVDSEIAESLKENDNGTEA